MLQSFRDGITSLVTSLTNRRNALSNNVIEKRPLSDVEKRNAYKTGLGNKIVRLKSGGALKDTLQFDNAHDRELYEQRLARHVKLAAKYMIGFGRGIIMLYERDADLSRPLPEGIDPRRLSMRVFSGDMVTVGNVSVDLQDPRYYKPLSYTVRGQPVHWTRVIDFTYVEPTEFDAPDYRYGGMSEFDLIHEQMIGDGIIERASANIVERNSTFVYKLQGFKEAIAQKREGDMVRYVAASEDARSMYGAALVDANDDVTSISQTLSNLKDADEISLRRVAMVTGIPIAVLVGENVKGLNSTGDNEMQVWQDAIEMMQSDYLHPPLERLFSVFGIAAPRFKENQGETPASRIAYEKEAIANAAILHQMSEDAAMYLQDKGITEADPWRKFVEGDDEEAEQAAQEVPQGLGGFLGGLGDA